MLKLVRLVAAIFSMLIFLQLQACSNMPTKAQNDPVKNVTEENKNQSDLVEENEPDCD